MGTYSSLRWGTIPARAQWLGADAEHTIIFCFYHLRFLKLMDTLENIKQQIADNAILLYMKGSPNAPQCGFSMRASQAMMACGKRFAYVDILSNPDIRAELPKYANWPTFPQLWVKGELIGGCDIIMEMYENGELKTLIDEASAEGEGEG
ncbi:hypothetical protein Misp06_02516 [Microbulbifer sp. NBRC 101763]